MRDVFIKGFVEGFEKMAKEGEGNIFAKILSKVSDEPAKEEAPEKPAEKPAEKPPEQEKTASDFDRIIAKLGLGVGEEKTASDEASEEELPSWMAKIAKKVDEDKEDKEDKKKKKKDEGKGEKKGEKDEGGMKALFAKMKG